MINKTSFVHSALYEYVKYADSRCSLLPYLDCEFLLKGLKRPIDVRSYTMGFKLRKEYEHLGDINSLSMLPHNRHF